VFAFVAEDDPRTHAYAKIIQALAVALAVPGVLLLEGVYVSSWGWLAVGLVAIVLGSWTFGLALRRR
jgi:hypothetical protein